MHAHIIQDGEGGRFVEAGGDALGEKYTMHNTADKRYSPKPSLHDLIQVSIARPLARFAHARKGGVTNYNF